ncbi:MAG: glycosyltransferase family 2 protein [Bacteroidales bacterium]|nr:glycosyltransferase family 2 protein [Bacteroidales bacterium]
MKYIVISPVRNEEDYIKLTLDSMICQTVLPQQWILVNDGSTDKTEEIIHEYTQNYSWIKLLTLTDRGFYFPGTGVVNVFNKGYELIEVRDWEFVVKLDVDLEFAPDYFELLLQRLVANVKIGIASGNCLLPINGNWIPEGVQDDHPVGPSKVYRRACWDQIGGLKPVPGWDLADLLSAQMNSWETACFKDLHIKHYRITGSRRKGVWAPKHLQGRFEYRHGYAFWYTFFKALKDIPQKPFLIGSIAKVFGYLNALFKNEAYLFEPEMRKFLRMKHKKYFFSKFGFKK